VKTSSATLRKLKVVGSNEEKGSSEGRDAHIVVVDDEPVICQQLERLYSHSGYSVTIANSADEALQRLESRNIDLVVTDIRLPGLSGIELTKRIQEELKEFVEARRKWISTGGGEGEKEHLGKVNLQRANLREADLRGANLREANLRGAYMIKADLQEANLVGADLQEATPHGANFQGAVLRDANLQGAKLLTTRGLTARQVKAAKNWELAFYSDDFLKELGLPPDHNERVERKLAELEKKKEVAAKK